MLPALVLTIVELGVLKVPTAIVGTVLATRLFFWASSAPVNAQRRARLAGPRVGLSIVCMHIFGELLSPPLCALVSDSTCSLKLVLGTDRRADGRRHLAHRQAHAAGAVERRHLRSFSRTGSSRMTTPSCPGDRRRRRTCNWGRGGSCSPRRWCRDARRSTHSLRALD